MGRDESSWTTIESDPGVFTELIEKIGVKGVQVEEIWSMDKDSLMQLSPVYGLVFLFKWEKQTTKREVDHDAHGTVFFAQQVIPNACATQAILSILLNIPPGTPGVDLGQELTGFREFTQELPPDMKGLAISNSDIIREVHNSMSRPESLLPDEDDRDKKGGEAFHFIAYLPAAGCLYELDGLQEGPIKLATNVNSENEFLNAVIPHITSRMEAAASGEVRFNLMALVADRRQVLQSKMSELEAQKLSLAPQDGTAQAESSDAFLLSHIEQELSSLHDALAGEEAKRKAWTEENIRRRHNYIPLMFNVLKVLASKSQLGEFVQLAKTTKKAKTGDS